MTHYTPQPGTIPARVLAWLNANPGEHTAAVIADALDIAAEGIATTLQPSIRHGLIRRTKTDGRVVFCSARHAPDGEPEDDGDDDGQMIQRVVSARRTTRWAVWSDGKVVIEQGRSRLELDSQDARSLGAFLQRAMSV